MPTINQLNATDTLSDGDLLAVFVTNNGDARKASLSLLSEYMSEKLTTADDKVSQYASPSATGFTVTITDNSNSAWLILTPTAGFAAGTIKLPTSTNAKDRQEILVNCTQSITTLTINGNGATVTGAPTSLAANAFFRLRFDAVASTWYRVG